MEKDVIKLLKKIHKSCEANNKVLKKVLKEISDQKTHRDDENTYNGLEPVGDIYITHDDSIEGDSTIYIGEEQ